MEREDPGAVVDEAEVRRIARLARLSLGGDEIRELASEMSTILGHFREIRRRETAEEEEAAGGEPSGGGVPGHTDDPEARAVLRSDESDPDPLRRPPEELAPGWRKGFFVVPRLAALDGAEGRQLPPGEPEPESGEGTGEGGEGGAA